MATRKDYREIAAIVKTEVGIIDGLVGVVSQQAATDATRSLMRAMAHYFRRDNSQFNYAKFYVACGFDVAGNEVL